MPQSNDGVLANRSSDIDRSIKSNTIKEMRDVIVGTLMLSSGVWFSLGFAYADFGMLWVAVFLAVLTFALCFAEAVYKRRYKSYDVQTYECVRYGDEFFLKDESGAVRPSSRAEVSKLYSKNQITKFK